MTNTLRLKTERADNDRQIEWAYSQVSAPQAEITALTQRNLQISIELAKLARRRIANRARRELMFDLNGHHGRA